MSRAYYNEFDPKAAAWLRELIRRGLIADGEVDERSIVDVRPDELRGFTQCHFFAGIGVWSAALRDAGWPDDRPVWTGSCPCQPFSTAGKGNGFADERHLWPAFHWLISECQPPVVFGEQVASKDGLTWIDLVCADLEGSDYTPAAADLCAAGVGAPHLRQRLYWVADSNRERHARERLLLRAEAEGRVSPKEVLEAPRRGTPGQLGDSHSEGLARPSRQREDDEPGLEAVERASGSVGWLGSPSGAGAGRNPGTVLGPEAGGCCQGIEAGDSRYGSVPPGSTRGFWENARWLHCRDEKWRPVEPGTFPLAHGAPARVGRLRGYGNAIVKQVAAEFIRAYQDTQLESIA